MSHAGVALAFHHARVQRSRLLPALLSRLHAPQMNLHARYTMSFSVVLRRAKSVLQEPRGALGCRAVVRTCFP